MATIGVVSCDPFFLEAFSNMLLANCREPQVWTSNDPVAALDRCLCNGRVSENAPDLLVMDIPMPHMGGVALCRIVRTATDRIPILALTSYDVAAYEDRVALAGAQCLLGKADREAIVAAVGVLARGGMWRTRPHSLFLSSGESHARLLETGGKSVLSVLTPLELEAVRSSCETRESYGAIAHRLGVNVSTLKSRLHSARAKLHVGSRTEMTDLWARAMEMEQWEDAPRPV